MLSYFDQAEAFVSHLTRLNPRIAVSAKWPT
jgi:hypothetical protein